MPPSEIVRPALVPRRPVEERSVAAHFDEDDAGAGREVGREDARVSLSDGCQDGAASISDRAACRMFAP